MFRNTPSLAEKFQLPVAKLRFLIVSALEMTSLDSLQLVVLDSHLRNSFIRFGQIGFILPRVYRS